MIKRISSHNEGRMSLRGNGRRGHLCTHQRQRGPLRLSTFALRPLSEGREPEPIAVPVEKRVRIAKTPTPRPAAKPIEKQTRPEKNGARRKADIYSERVTLQISPDMRDEVDSMARQLQRSKITKAERITADSVVRVAIRYFLDEFSPRRGEDVNSEDELLAAAKRQSRDE